MGDELALVIEDHEDISSLFSLVLQEAGFQAEIIGNGDEAITRLADVVPGVVILDLHLPGAQGDEILHRIRTDERMAKTQVVVITAYTALARTLQDEADLVLIKPISLNLLRRLVGRLRSTDDWGDDLPSVIGPGDEVE